MSNFIQECLSVFRSFVSWTFSTQSGLGVTIGGLLVGINVLGVIVHYLFERYK